MGSATSIGWVDRTSSVTNLLIHVALALRQLSCPATNIQIQVALALYHWTNETYNLSLLTYFPHRIELGPTCKMKYIHPWKKLRLHGILSCGIRLTPIYLFFHIYFYTFTMVKISYLTNKSRNICEFY